MGRLLSTGQDQISEQGVEVTIYDMREDVGHIVTEVKILLVMSHKTLTSAEENIK